MRVSGIEEGAEVEGVVDLVRALIGGSESWVGSWVLKQGWSEVGWRYAGEVVGDIETL